MMSGGIKEAPKTYANIFWLGFERKEVLENFLEKKVATQAWNQRIQWSFYLFAALSSP